jgi:hypothetical protein
VQDIQEANSEALAGLLAGDLAQKRMQEAIQLEQVGTSVPPVRERIVDLPSLKEALAANAEAIAAGLARDLATKRMQEAMELENVRISASQFAI